MISNLRKSISKAPCVQKSNPSNNSSKCGNLSKKFSYKSYVNVCIRDDGRSVCTPTFFMSIQKSTFPLEGTRRLIILHKAIRNLFWFLKTFTFLRADLRQERHKQSYFVYFLTEIHLWNQFRCNKTVFFYLFFRG